MKSIVTLLLVCFCIVSYAQPPLNKRDQQRKAEFEAKITAEEKYEELFDQANEAFEAKNYKEARMTFEEAIQYNPEQEQWLTSKVNDLDILMAKNIARQVDSVLVTLPAKKPQSIHVAAATPALPEREIEESLPPPVEEVVEEQVEIVEPEMKVEEEPISKPIEKAPEVAVAIKEEKPAVVKPEEVKVKETFVDLPQGLTENLFEFPDHTVLRVVVKDGIDTIVFKRVKHRWGGEFYFQDDVSISKRFWIEELERFKEKHSYTSVNF